MSESELIYAENKGEAETLVEAALRVLNTADLFEKAKLGDEIACKWLQGTISLPYHPRIHLHVPHRPSRPTHVLYSTFVNVVASFLFYFILFSIHLDCILYI